MSKFTTFVTKISKKIKSLATKEYLIYTGMFLGIMLSVYIYMIFAGMASTPGFTYSEF